MSANSTGIGALQTRRRTWYVPEGICFVASTRTRFTPLAGVDGELGAGEGGEAEVPCAAAGVRAPLATSDPAATLSLTISSSTSPNRTFQQNEPIIISGTV